MIDYWSKLKLDECWSKQKRFNIMMNYILNGEEEPSEQTDEPITDNPTVEEVGSISVTVTDNENQGIDKVNVTVTDGTTTFEGKTGSAGGCTISNVPFGEYTIEAVAEGYATTTDTITVNQAEQDKTLILTEE